MCQHMEAPVLPWGFHVSVPASHYRDETAWLRGRLSLRGRNLCVWCTHEPGFFQFLWFRLPGENAANGEGKNCLLPTLAN